MTSQCPNSSFKTTKQAKNPTLVLFLSFLSSFFPISLLLLSLFLLSSVKKDLKHHPNPSPSLPVFFLNSFSLSIYIPSSRCCPLSLCSCRLCQQRCLQTLIDDGCRWLELCPAFCFYQNTLFLSFFLSFTLCTLKTFTTFFFIKLLM